MFMRLMSALVFFFMFGCAGAQTVPPANPNEITVTRNTFSHFVDGEQAIYIAAASDGTTREVLLIDQDALYYHSWPGGAVAGDSTFTVTVDPNHPSLRPFYGRYPEGLILRPAFYVLGGGDNYLPLRAEIDFRGPGLFIESGHEEGSFTYSAPGGIQTQFILMNPRPPGSDDPGVCPSGEAFSATMVHETVGSYRVVVRYSGRSSFHGCRYSVDLVEEDES